MMLAAAAPYGNLSVAKPTFRLEKSNLPKFSSWISSCYAAIHDYYAITLYSY